MRKKNVFILGSTGTIGLNTLKVIDRFPERFTVIGLSAYRSAAKLARQVRRYRPKYVAVCEDSVAKVRRDLAGVRCRTGSVNQDLPAYVSEKDVDIVVVGMSGSAALAPFWEAVRAGKTVAPANKEALVIAGQMLMAEAQKHGAKVIPIDSEQSAIYQCLEGQPRAALQKVILTASGGALLRVPRRQFDRLSVEQILAHPRWRMGPKITVDSATLMNKGFEMIEAARLFGLAPEEIEVLVHPQAIIHSMVAFQDGSILAQLGATDMRLPIQYALTHPERLPTNLPAIDFVRLKELTFEKPDEKRFRSLRLAGQALKTGGTAPCVLNAADEVAVDAFLKGKICFTAIMKTVEGVLQKHKSIQARDLNDIIEADTCARAEAQKWLASEK